MPDTLARHIKVLSGWAFPSDGFNELEGLPLIRIRDLGSGTTEVKFKGSYDSRYVIDDGDVLIGMDGDFSVEKWVGGKALLNQRVCKVESTSEDLDQSFLFWYLIPHVADIHRKTPQTTVRHLSASSLGKIEAPRISVAEQRAANKVLDTLDATIRQTEAIIEKLKQVKRGLLHDLLTRGIDANGELRPPQNRAPELYKESVLGWIPREWEAPLFSTIAIHITSGSRGWAAHYAESGALFVRSQNIRMGQLDFTDRQHVRPPSGSEGQRTKIAPCDLLITITGNGVGNVACVPREWQEAAFVSQHVGLIRFSDPELAQFAMHYLVEGSPGNQQLIDAQYGQSKPGLNLETLRDLRIPAPTNIEREMIVEHISCAQGRIEVERQLATQLRALKSGLMEDLLTGRVRVTPLLA